MKKIRLHDKSFRLLLESEYIDREIRDLAHRINHDLQQEAPLFMSVLNGAFMFTSDLLKEIDIPGCEVSFVKMASYEGTESTGKVKYLIGLNEDITERTVVIVEDIVDSGKSMEFLLEELQRMGAGKILIATLFFKPQALIKDIKVDYHAIILENDFVVGRGLDYNGLGRNFPDLYILDKEG